MLSLSMLAQPALTKPASQDVAFGDALNKIVADFRNNFVNIQGEKLPPEPDAAASNQKCVCPAQQIARSGATVLMKTVQQAGKPSLIPEKTMRMP